MADGPIDNGRLHAMVLDRFDAVDNRIAEVSGSIDKLSQLVNSRIQTTDDKVDKLALTISTQSVQILVNKDDTANNKASIARIGNDAKQNKKESKSLWMAVSAIVISAINAIVFGILQLLKK